ncbi:MAG: cyclic nucleotide-binding domain-containing protein [endosymbiont of Galathealinum brachiosum]|uniref:Cyclic nucleotide-binding domain-containing protein n=1 Tax=endosymbiont of Galathealinum brachiosum TaxID=2200906 RepID=A0A370DH85_9GAMM|nr:MAG: cyclic nucleotide-binding domain-containing protein [endosymbiont of Galathealinum brachiosum]
MSSQHPFWQNLFRHKQDRTSEVTDMWMSTPLFNKITKRECRELVKTMHPRHYKKGELVFNSGDIGASIVLIRSGGIEIKAVDKLLAELISGDFFGEIALIIDEPRTADAIAAEDSELIFFLRSDLEEWVKRSPKSGAQFMLNIATVLAARLRHTNILLSLQNN